MSFDIGVRLRNYRHNQDNEHTLPSQISCLPTAYPRQHVLSSFLICSFIILLNSFLSFYQHRLNGLREILRVSDHSLFHEALDFLCFPHFHFSLLLCDLERSGHALLSWLLAPNCRAWRCEAAPAAVFHKPHRGGLYGMLKVWFADVDIRTKNITIGKSADGFFSMAEKSNIMFLINVDLPAQK